MTFEPDLFAIDLRRNGFFLRRWPLGEIYLELGFSSRPSRPWLEWERHGWSVNMWMGTTFVVFGR